MITLEAMRIGNLRIRLVERPGPYDDLAVAHYLISEHVSCRTMAAVAYAGYSAAQARRQWVYYVEREQARVAANQDSGL